MGKDRNIRIKGDWEPEGFLQKAGSAIYDDPEFGDKKWQNALEKAAQYAKMYGGRKVFGPAFMLGNKIYNMRMGKEFTPERAEKKANKLQEKYPDDFTYDPTTGEYHLNDEYFPGGDNPNWEQAMEALSGQFSEDPEFGQDYDASFLEGAGPEDGSFDPTSGGDDYGWEDDMGIPPAPPPPTWSGMDPYSEMAVSPSYGTGERLMKEPTIQDIINSMEDPRSKAAAFDALRNPFSDPGMHEAFAPGADISIDQPFDPRGGPGRFADMGMGGGINDLISRGAALEGIGFGFGGGGGGGVGNAMYLY